MKNPPKRDLKITVVIRGVKTVNKWYKPFIYKAFAC